MMASTIPARNGPKIAPPRMDAGTSTTRLDVSRAKSTPAASGITPAVVSRLTRSQLKS